MKKPDGNKKLKKAYAILLAVLLCAGILLTVALVCYFKSSSGGGAGLVRSETLYVMVALLVILAALLLVLLIVSLIKKDSETVEIEVKQAEISAGETAPAPNESGTRFDGLTRIDKNKAEYERADYTEDITLESLCERFQNYSADKLKLYYDIGDIRRFIAGMAVSKIMILQGMSGTGKTSLAYAFGEFLDNTSTVIPVQPMWKERTDLIGYFNEFTKRFNETDLLKKMYEANYSKDIYITVLDEMNIARVEYYFAEFLSLLELPDEEKRSLTVVSDEWKDDPEQLKDGHIILPKNMWFIGTANNDDSTFAISDKVYDRAMIMDLDKKAEPFIAKKTNSLHITAERLEELIEEAKEEYKLTERNKRRLEKLDKYMIDTFRVTFGNRIMKQITEYIPVYVACGGDELEALDDILAKKVMRKLGAQNPVYIRNNAEKFIRHMEELFGEDGLPLCKAHVERLLKNS
ncbi:MAG: AAA family ATPase [Clostridia bacterium]|nr:AAA family ATPase [Clostridia bacterium]